MLEKYIKDNTIIISNKNKIPSLIKKIRAKSFINLKFMTLDELRELFFFKYDEKTLYYLINKYNYNYDIALKLIKNLYYIKDKKYKNEKLNNLVSLKKELLEQKLLYQNQLINNYLGNNNIIIYDYILLNKYDSIFIDELKKITKITIINKEREETANNTILEFNDIEDEVVFVAEKIVELINNNIDINKIKICGPNNEYNNIINRIFHYYKLPLIIDNSTIYNTKIGQLFIKNLNKNINNTIDIINKEIDLNIQDNLKIYNSIINIINKYAWCDDYNKVKEMLINDFKKTKINNTKYEKRIDIINSLDEANDDEYIFLMSFNQGIIPNIYKDEDYLNDKIKQELNIDTSNDLNTYSTNKWLYNIKHTKNLTITYKKYSNQSEYYISSLNDILNYNIIKENIEYSNYSHLFNKIALTKKIDDLIKYNTHSEILDILYNNYKELKYLTYNNSFTGIDPNILLKYINNKLTLSYSAINNYYHCAFKYYLSNILKLNIYEKTFHTIIGNLFHYILSICFIKDIDIKKEYYDYIENEEYQFNAKELFFLDKLYEELIFIIETIKKQNQYNSLSQNLYEEKIEIDKSKKDINIIFKGFIDKINYDDKQKTGIIIDYKTGSADINLNNIIYGLDMQLPIYLYLTKNKYPNMRIIGFYLQKILHNKPNIDKKHTYKEINEDKLKLLGYTSMYDSDIKIIDSNYAESKVIKGMKTTSKGLGSKKVYDNELIEKIYNLTDNKVNEAIDNILNASFTINPKKIGMNNIGCKYCNFKDICFSNEANLINLKEYKNLEFFDEKE
ncbi:MAG: PD-(D/E)XK nuclease family protein [Bacilli bacterium]|nr:PD-(D/E)XK nuclease family protein [Bacilli bacterium]